LVLIGFSILPWKAGAAYVDLDQVRGDLKRFYRAEAAAADSVVWVCSVPPMPTPPHYHEHAAARAIEIIARGVWIEHGQILLCRNIAGGYFYLPGGHVEFGEPAGEALRREFVEEAGIRVQADECLLVGESSFEQAGKVRHEINLVFHVEHASPSSGTAPTPVRSLEPHIDFEWVAISRLAQIDVRPRWLADWIVAHGASPAAPRFHGTAWLSVMTTL
jgi:8-oxo-dGTP diphosphatase